MKQVITEIDLAEHKKDFNQLLKDLKDIYEARARANLDFLNKMNDS